LRSFSDAIVSATARISSVGSTQSIGIELHRSDGQFSRCDPFPTVPPCTWICRPRMILPQTRQKRLSSRERHSRNRSRRRNASSLSESDNTNGGDNATRQHICRWPMLTQSGARWIRLSVKTLRAHVLARIGDPRRYESVASRCAISDPGHRKKHTSKITESCVLHANEQKRSIVVSPPFHGLCVGSDVTDGALLRGPSREPVSGAPAEIVCSRRAVDRAAGPDRRRRNCRDWGYCYSGLAGVRRPISGGTAAARRDNRPPPQRSASSISKVGARVTATSLSQLVLHRDTNQG
jgi:hypothetical protein